MMLCLVVMAGQAGADDAASTRGLTVKAADPAPVSASARTIVTVVFLIDNTDSAMHTASPMLVLPPGWRSMAPLFPMELAPGAGDIVLGSFIIPGDARAGSYHISCTLEGSGEGVPGQSAVIDVVVPIVRSLELSAVSAPKNALSGDTYESRFVAANNGNVEEPVEVQVESGSSFPFAQDAKAFVLPPGASRELTVKVSIPEKLERSGRHTVTARLLGGGQAGPAIEARTTVELIPRTPAGDVWHRLPLSFSATGSWGQGEATTWSHGESLSGRGTLDDGDTMNLAFSIAPPTYPPPEEEAAAEASGEVSGEEPSDGTLEEELKDLSKGSYYLGFWTAAFGFHAGDRSYTVSPLTSGARAGRGLEAFLARGDLVLRGFADASSAEDSAEYQYGASLKYGTDSFRFVALNYSNKTGKAADGIYGVDGFLRPYDSANIAFEAASGGAGAGDYIYSLGIDGREAVYSYQLKTLRAGPDYQGTVQDKELYSANASLSAFEGITLSGGYNKETANPGLLPGRTALSIEGLRTNLAWGFGSGTRFTAQWKRDGREDLSAARSIDELTESIEAHLEWTLEKLQLDGSVSMSTYTNLLRSDTRKNASYNLTAKYVHDRDLTMVFAARYAEGSPLLTSGDGTVSFSASVDYTYRRNTSISVDFRTSNPLDSYLEGSDSLSLSLRHEFPNDSDLSLAGTYGPSRNPEKPDAISITASYHLPLSIPVSRRTDIGTLQGRVFEAETGLAIAGILVSLEGMTAVTNGEGKYRFPAVTVGTYKLQVNTSLAGIDRIPDGTSPDTVVIADQTVQIVDIALTRPVRVSGVINQYTTEGGMLGAAGAGLLFEKGLPNILCEVSNGTDAWRTLTDAAGKFAFPKLLPGRWILKVYEKNIPATHYIEEMSREFIVEPGGAAEAEVRIIPRIRNIIFTEEEIVLGSD
jgi:hypothetical protein